MAGQGIDAVEDDTPGARSRIADDLRVQEVGESDKRAAEGGGEGRRIEQQQQRQASRVARHRPRERRHQAERAAVAGQAAFPDREDLQRMAYQ